MSKDLNTETEELLQQIADYYKSVNYNYLYLKCKMDQAIKETNAVTKSLFIGNSHGLCGILEEYFQNAANISMQSQDLYYDYLITRRVTEQEKAKTSLCFIVMGYYIAYHDLSLARKDRTEMIMRTFYPLLHDSHNWDAPKEFDPWSGIEESDIPSDIKHICEMMAYLDMQKRKNYYGDGVPRISGFLPNGKRWFELTDSERDSIGRKRAADHSRLSVWKDTFSDNKEIFRDYIHYLAIHDIIPIVLVTPYSDNYLCHFDPGMIDGFYELLSSAEEDVQVFDCNLDEIRTIFHLEDFNDADHLNERGAQKLSRLLAEEFSI